MQHQNRKAGSIRTHSRSRSKSRAQHRSHRGLIAQSSATPQQLQCSELHTTTHSTHSTLEPTPQRAWVRSGPGSTQRRSVRTTGTSFQHHPNTHITTRPGLLVQSVRPISTTVPQVANSRRVLQRGGVTTTARGGIHSESNSPKHSQPAAPSGALQLTTGPTDPALLNNLRKNANAQYVTTTRAPTIPPITPSSSFFHRGIKALFGVTDLREKLEIIDQARVGFRKQNFKLINWPGDEDMYNFFHFGTTRRDEFPSFHVSDQIEPNLSQMENENDSDGDNNDSVVDLENNNQLPAKKKQFKPRPTDFNSFVWGEVVKNPLNTWVMPARPELPILQHRLTSHKDLNVPLNAHILHTLAHIELNAVEMYLDTILRFAIFPPNAISTTRKLPPFDGIDINLMRTMLDSAQIDPSRPHGDFVQVEREMRQKVYDDLLAYRRQNHKQSQQHPDLDILKSQLDLSELNKKKKQDNDRDGSDDEETPFDPPTPAEVDHYLRSIFDYLDTRVPDPAVTRTPDELLLPFSNNWNRGQFTPRRAALPLYAQSFPADSRFPILDDGYNLKHPAFVNDMLSIVADEARHFTQCCERLDKLSQETGKDYRYGSQPATFQLWVLGVNTRRDVAERLAVIPLSQEARGLDSTTRFVDKLYSLGDKDSALIVTQIGKEEERHVALGVKWMLYTAAARGVVSPSFCAEYDYNDLPFFPFTEPENWDYRGDSKPSKAYKQKLRAEHTSSPKYPQDLDVTVFKSKNDAPLLLDEAIPSELEDYLLQPESRDEIVKDYMVDQDGDAFFERMSQFKAHGVPLSRETNQLYKTPIGDPDTDGHERGDAAHDGLPSDAEFTLSEEGDVREFAAPTMENPHPELSPFRPDFTKPPEMTYEAIIREFHRMKDANGGVLYEPDQMEVMKQVIKQGKAENDPEFADLPDFSEIEAKLSSELTTTTTEEMMPDPDDPAFNSWEEAVKKLRKKQGWGESGASSETKEKEDAQFRAELKAELNRMPDVPLRNDGDPVMAQNPLHDDSTNRTSSSYSYSSSQRYYPLSTDDSDDYTNIDERGKRLLAEFDLMADRASQDSSAEAEDQRRAMTETVSGALWAQYGPDAERIKAGLQAGPRADRSIFCSTPERMDYKRRKKARMTPEQHAARKARQQKRIDDSLEVTRSKSEKRAINKELLRARARFLESSLPRPPIHVASASPPRLLDPKLKAFCEEQIAGYWQINVNHHFEKGFLPPFNRVARYASGMPESWYIPLATPNIPLHYVTVPPNAPIEAPMRKHFKRLQDRIQFNGNYWVDLPKLPVSAALAVKAKTLLRFSMAWEGLAKKTNTLEEDLKQLKIWQEANERAWAEMRSSSGSNPITLRTINLSNFPGENSLDDLLMSKEELRLFESQGGADETTLDNFDRMHKLLDRAKLHRETGQASPLTPEETQEVREFVLDFRYRTLVAKESYADLHSSNVMRSVLVESNGDLAQVFASLRKKWEDGTLERPDLSLIPQFAHGSPLDVFLDQNGRFADLDPSTGPFDIEAFRRKLDALPPDMKENFAKNQPLIQEEIKRLQQESEMDHDYSSPKLDERQGRLTSEGFEYRPKGESKPITITSSSFHDV